VSKVTKRGLLMPDDTYNNVDDRWWYPLTGKERVSRYSGERKTPIPGEQRNKEKRPWVTQVCCCLSISRMLCLVTMLDRSLGPSRTYTVNSVESHILRMMRKQIFTISWPNRTPSRSLVILPINRLMAWWSWTHMGWFRGSRKDSRLVMLSHTSLHLYLIMMIVQVKTYEHVDYVNRRIGYRFWV
jgi:hypothetical protein